MIRPLLAALALASTVVLSAQSQPPVPSGGEAEGRQPEDVAAPLQDNPNANQRGTKESPLIIQEQPTEDARQAAERNEQRADSQTASNWWNVRITALLVLVALGTGLVVGWQAWETRKAADAAKLSARAAEASATGLMNAERAYVGIRYRQRGDDWPEQFSFHRCSNSGTLVEFGDTCRRLHVRIINTGRTPAHIIGGGVRPIVNLDENLFDPLSASFTDGQRISPNFLHAAGHYSEKLTYTLKLEEEAAASDDRLWLVGFIVYKDAFKRRHRAGFCRRVGRESKPTKNNLSTDSSCQDYNYDYEIDDEGNRKQATTPQISRRKS